jgi:hypothetical protein
MSPARAGRITDLAVTHKERLTRFGFGFLKRSFTGHGVRIHVVVDGGGDDKPLQDELVDGLISTVSGFSGIRTALGATARRAIWWRPSRGRCRMQDADASGRCLGSWSVLAASSA